MNYTCKTCGGQFDSQLGICPSCGTPVEAAPQDNQQAGFQQPGYPQAGYQQPGYQQPGYQQSGYPMGGPTPPKSKMAAGLLGIFLGAWGVHNFYLGFTSKAVIQIVVTIVTCGLGGLWGFIEGIMILAGSINTDADGRPLAQ